MTYDLLIKNDSIIDGTGSSQKRADLAIEEAIHKMTGELAASWGLADRGTLEEGKAADTTIFDPDNIAALKEEFVDECPGEAR
tara:strand:- start:1969 stop:2217 length:249 start_codon:yes stop_codon:yes gene_type:complete